MLKKFSVAIVLLIGLLYLIYYFISTSLEPQYSGKAILSGLESKSTVYFDKYGVPHIYADSELDAYRTLGYVHAQDRLWQMELVRRIGPGRLSEIFGKDLLSTDLFFRTLGVHQYSQEQVARLTSEGDPKVLNAAQAYLDGINAYMHHGPTPIEFIILGIEKRDFELVDIYNVLGYMSISFAQAHKTEPILTQIYQKYGPKYLEDLDIDGREGTQLMMNHQLSDSLLQISRKVSAIMDQLPAAAFIGSNSWVLGPSKTKSGKAILANDPHIGYSQPAVWYEAHIEAPGFSLYGFHLAGFPFAVIGHNRKMATGMTMFENDDIDLYFEKLSKTDSTQYIQDGKTKAFANREETIVVKDSVDILLKVRSTGHGPIVNEALGLGDSIPPVSMMWTYVHLPSDELDILYRLQRAESMGEAREQVGRIHAPGLNMMYADMDGNYARWSAAVLTHRSASATPKLIMDGSDSKYDPLGYYDFSYNPKSENAPWGYAYSANNQPDSIHGISHPGYYLPEDRANRIIELLDQDKKWDVNDTKTMMLDYQSNTAMIINRSILQSLDYEQLKDPVHQSVLEMLKSWDGNFKEADPIGTIFNKLIFKIQQLAMQDELGKESFEAYLKTHVMKRSLEPLIANDSSVWWDDVSTDQKENRSDIITSAFVTGIEELKAQLGDEVADWQWGKVHQLEHQHVFGKVSLLRGIFNVGPFEVSGSNEVINNYLFSLNEMGEAHVHAGPSTRRIVDFGDVEKNSWSILPTGNSGNVFSPHYEDQAKMYVQGKFRRMLMNKKEIKSVSKAPLILVPK